MFHLVCRTERQWCDLATSLSLLSMCERGFKKLQECWECYSDKLTEPGVYQPLLSIMVKLRRGAKPQFKVLLTPPWRRPFRGGGFHVLIHFGAFRLRWRSLKSV